MDHPVYDVRVHFLDLAILLAGMSANSWVVQKEVKTSQYNRNQK